MLSRVASALIIAGILVVLFTVLAMVFHERRGPVTNWLLFLGIAIPVSIATLYSAGTTIALNTMAETRGPVHWHADFEIFVCGKPLDIKSPENILNRVGTSVLHEHGDNRIHIEGVLLRVEDASLGRFFRVIGGYLTGSSLAVPTDKGLVTANNGDLCPDGSPGVLQVFRFSPENGRIVQQKLARFSAHVPAAENKVPPGDCIIIEFGPERQFTDHLCASYRAAIARGDLYGG